MTDQMKPFVTVDKQKLIFCKICKDLVGVWGFFVIVVNVFSCTSKPYIKNTCIHICIRDVYLWNSKTAQSREPVAVSLQLRVCSSLSISGVRGNSSGRQN